MNTSNGISAVTLVPFDRDNLLWTVFMVEITCQRQDEDHTEIQHVIFGKHVLILIQHISI